jgi:hypothetical protein
MAGGVDQKTHLFSAQPMSEKLSTAEVSKISLTI